MSFVVDLSYGWPVCTGEALKRIGASGVIGYTGCDDVAKNVGRDIFTSWLDAGLQVALVIENGPQDMLGGDKAGAYLGQNWLRGAEQLGYDVEHCIGYTAADWHVTLNQFDQVADAFDAFCGFVDVAGLYAPGPMLDYLGTSSLTDGGAHGLWNSESTSFGPISVHANLIQRYDDPRAQGMPVDVNDVAALPLYMMSTARPAEGGDMVEIWWATDPATGTAAAYAVDGGKAWNIDQATLTALRATPGRVEVNPVSWEAIEQILVTGTGPSVAGKYTATGSFTVAKET